MACKYKARNFKNYFNSLGRQLNDYTAGLSDLAKEDALRSVRERLILKDPDLAVVIDAVLYDHFPNISESIINDPDTLYEKHLSPRDIQKINQGVSDFTTMVDRIDRTKDLMEDPVGEHVELRGSNQFSAQFSELGLENFDDLYSAYTGQVHSPKEMREIFDQIRTEPDFDDFLEWVDG